MSNIELKENLFLFYIKKEILLVAFFKKNLKIYFRTNKQTKKTKKTEHWNSFS